MSGLIIKKVIGCARCGDDHLNILFEPLDRPFAPPEAGGVKWTHWAPCPLNGQPIMLIVGAMNEGVDEVEESRMPKGDRDVRTDD